MNTQIHEIDDRLIPPALASSELYCGFDISSLNTQAVNLHLLFDRNGTPEARCSLWWQDVPHLPGEKLGVIGHYAASSPVASLQLLHRACSQLRTQGCTLAVGPMNGNTWRSYRFVTAGNDEPPYFLEPSNPSTWPEYWEQAGFSSLASYTSGVSTDLSLQDARLPRVEQRLHEAGVTLRPINLDNFSGELNSIFNISLTSFSKNYLYTPISQQEFIAQYTLVNPLIKPELTLIAEQAGKAIGFLFAIPDLLEQQRTGTIQTAIIKTVAVLPGTRHAGLGALMVDKVQQEARKLGMTRAIHALMHDSNHSRNISGHYATTMRRYTLFSYRL